MKALAKVDLGEQNVDFIDIAKPQCKPDEVLIKVYTVGVCGSDFHIYKNLEKSHSEALNIIPPRILGHEFCGEVIEVGNEVTTHKIGDRIVGEICFNSCGVCKLCKLGYPQVCSSRTGPGTHMDGAFTEYFSIPAKLAHKIDDDIDYETAVLAEPTAVAVHGFIEKTGINAEDIVVIFGPGTIGLISVQLAKVYGASKVILVGSDMDEALRLPCGERIGADYVFNINKTNIVNEIMKITNGIGADIVVECSGAQSAINSGIEVLRKAGRMSVIGLPNRDQLNIDWKKAVIKALDLNCSYSSAPTSWEITMSLINRKGIQLNKLVTHKEPLDNWQYVFDETEKGNVIKALIYPSM